MHTQYTFWKFISDNWDKVTTVILAAWGAYLSTLLYLKDKPKIRVTASQGFLTAMDFTEVINCTITNSGKRPITVTNFNFETNSTKKEEKAIYFIQPQSFAHKSADFPKRLIENDSLTFTLYTKPIVDLMDKKGFRAVKLVFQDTTGKRYVGKIPKYVFHIYDKTHQTL